MIEKDVVNIVKKWLEKQGYSIEAPHTNGYQSLIDIYAWKKGEPEWFIEAKSGDEAIYKAFGQLIAQAKKLSKNIKYAIALPSPEIESYVTVHFEKFADTNTRIWKTLNLYFLLVGKMNSILVISPEEAEGYFKSYVRSKWKKNLI